MSSLVSKCTSDDTQPIPLYTLKELADLSQKSVRDCETIRSALLNRLARSSPDIKFKALRVIKYLCQNGRIDFKMAFQRDNTAIKALVTFVCKPDELRGEKPAENVRQEAQECLEAIFADHQLASDTSMKMESMGNTPLPAQHYQNNNLRLASQNSSQYGGFGSSSSSSSYTHNPTPQSNAAMSQSVTGLNLRRTIGAFLVGESEQSYNNRAAQPAAVPVPQSQYGGISSASYSTQPYSSQPVEQARSFGYDTHSQTATPYQPTQQQTSGSGFKAGPWGKGGLNTPQQQQQQQQHQQQSNQQNYYQQKPQQQNPGAPQDYVSKTGPSTKNSVEELGFERRIIAQYTTNTPLKPNLTETELKKFTQDSHACGIDDILNLLYTEILSQWSNLPIPTINKAIQIYNTIINACGMVTMEENNKEHIKAIYDVYQNLNNKHTKASSEKVLVTLNLVQDTSANNNAGQAITGFVAPTNQEYAQAAPAPTKSSAPQQFGNNANEDFMDIFGNNNNNTAAPVQQQQQTPSAAAPAQKKMFGGLQLKSKNQQQAAAPAQDSAFDFMGGGATTSEPPQQQQQQQQQQQSGGDDLLSLFGNTSTNTSNNNGGLNLDSLYGNTTQPKLGQTNNNNNNNNTTDFFASLAPSQPVQQQQQPQQQQQESSSFDFMTTTTTTNNNAASDDIFGDLLAPKPAAQQAPVQQQQQKPQASTNQFDFVDAFNF